MWTTSETSARGYDLAILICVVALATVGTLMVYSTSSVYALEKFGDPGYFLKRHAIYLFVGFSAMFALMNSNYEGLRKFVYPAYGLGLILLVAVLMPGVGIEASGARRWINAGLGSFQPSEFAKYLLVLYLAHSLVRKRDKVENFVMGFASHLTAAGIYIFLILLQPDFGMTLILVLMLMGMLFVGDVKLKYLAGFGVVSACLLALAVLTEGYRMRRIVAFMDPWKDPLGSGYQVIQSFVAFGLGGLGGAGLGDSSQKLFFLPQAHTDFIFSIIGEELGFVGVAAVVGAFGFLIARCLRVALRAPDLFGCYLVFGCTMLIALQTGINMAVAVGLMPTKGLTLPFISYGGSSLVSSLAAVGVILSVSRGSNK
ncbi:MAG: putative lipid II flippase FtsW [Deltaproteobacteria bacterium]